MKKMTQQSPRIIISMTNSDREIYSQRLFRCFSLKRFSKLILLISLISQIGFGPVFPQLANAAQNGNLSPYTQLMSSLSGDTKAYINRILKAADEIESGRIPSEKVGSGNPFKLGNQIVEIVGVGYYDLNNYQVNIQKPTVTGFNVVYDDANKLLVIEGLRGQNSQGQNGVVVARHFVSGIDIAHFARDKEMIAFVDKSGRLSVIPMDYVVKNVFSSPLVVVENLWSPSADLNRSGEFEVKFLTPGLDPAALGQVDDSTLLPKDVNGNAATPQAGDIAIIETNGAQKRLVGIFSREITYDRIVVAFKYLLLMQMQIHPAKMNPDLVNALLQDLKVIDAKTEFESAENTIPQLVRRALINIDAASTTDSIRQNQKLGSKLRHSMPASRWSREFEALRERSEIQEVLLREEIRKNGGEGAPENNDSISRANKIQSLLQQSDLSPIWREIYPLTTEMPTVHNPVNKVKKQRAWLGKVKEYSFKYLVPFLGTGAVFAYPAVYEANETWQQIKILAWLYESLPEVLKDASYRFPALFGSTFSLLALWPASVAISWATGKAFKVIGKAVENSSTKTGQILRDMAKKWTPLTEWQRITSAGMRFFGTITYPIANFTITTVMRQPGVVSAWLNRLNPFKNISANSEVGKRLGLKADLRVGVINPFLTGDSRKEILDAQAQVQGILSTEKMRIDNLAWKIASIVVGHSEHVDPATIMLVAKGDLNPKDLRAAFTSKESIRRWELAQQDIVTVLKNSETDFFAEDIEKLDAQKMEKLVSLAISAVEKIKSQSKNKDIIRSLWLKAKQKLMVVNDSFLTLGLRDSKFLRTEFTNKQVSEQTERGFVPDHIMCTVIYALIGERAKLDSPHELAADPNGFLYTAGYHWSDMFLNTYAHFFSASSKRALVFQSVHVEEEDLYDPIEYSWASITHRKENFWETTKQWFKGALDPRVSDVGTFGVRAFQKRITTLQAGIIMGVGVRLGLAHQSPIDAFLGFFMFFHGAQWFFGWPWDFIDRGANYEGQRIAEMKKAYGEALAKLSQGLEEPNEARAISLRTSGAQALFELYQKHSPEFSKLLEKLSNQQGLSDLIYDYKRNVGSDQSLFFPQILSLYLALLSKNQTKISIASDELRLAIQKHSSDNRAGSLESLSNLDGRNLLNYALNVVPIHTEAHPLVNWITVTGFGAIGTTLMSTYLAVLTFDPNYLNFAFVTGLAAANLGGYWLYYHALKRDGWVSGALDKVETSWKAKTKPESSFAAKCIQYLMPKK